LLSVLQLTGERELKKKIPLYVERPKLKAFHENFSSYLNTTPSKYYFHKFFILEENF
jgi:hypothetical protein